MPRPSAWDMILDSAGGMVVPITCRRAQIARARCLEPLLREESCLYRAAIAVESGAAAAVQSQAHQFKVAILELVTRRAAAWADLFREARVTRRRR